MKKIWIFSFECTGVVKVGGLGEAVYNIAKHLAEQKFEVTLFMPSHGAHTNLQLMKRLQLRKSDFISEGKIGDKNFLPYRTPFRYKIGIYEGLLDNFRVILFYGLNDVTSKILDDTIVYRATQIEDKALLFARGISGYVDHLKNSEGDFPAIIHAHDYHAVPAAVVAKQKLEEYGHKAAMVLTIHLLSNKKVSWNYLSENWCGIKNKVHPVYLDGTKNMLSHKQLLKKAKLKIEAFGAMEAHALTSVSQNYLHHEVLPQIGIGCKEKAMYHWNGCDWNFEHILKEILERFGGDLQKISQPANIKRYHLRKYFLTEALGKLSPEEPVLEEGEVKETVNALEYPPFCGRGKVEPFNEDGPMVLMTGRLTQQKGVDLIFKAIPQVLNNIPNAKFILLLLPLEEEIDLVKKFAKLTQKYSNSVRILFGKAPSVYTLAHLSADVFVCPSRWEPFGIMALEAMATGNPVIATNVGGLKEIVIDARRYPKNGTGVLVPKNDHKQLSVAISSLLAIMQISEELQLESGVSDKKLNELTGQIAYDNLKKIVTKQPSYGLNLRENAMQRVERTFRWNKIIKKVIKAYEKADRILKQL
ncbi:MAG: glycosyltransferase [Candidatus Bathyarchaeia archaeon]